MTGFDGLGNIYNDFFGGIAGEIGASTVSNTTSDAGLSAIKADSKAEAKEEIKENAAPEPEIDPMDELEELTGLESIKHDVKELIAYVKVQKMRSEKGLKSVPVSLHLVFTGNPGTGKTTVARIIAKLYKKIGVLSKGQLVEVDRSGLVAGYVGQTAIKTGEKIKEAKGGVLFVDEAYALAKDGDDYGQESIDTILKAMEDNRDDFVVIVAGYTEPMKKFIDSNPGLRSRFNKYINFEDYSIEELIAIFNSYCRKYEYSVGEEDLERIGNLIKLRKAKSDGNFANAREVRNMFEEIITNQARRISLMEDPTEEDMKQILFADIEDMIKTDDCEQ
ncbi:MAG: AAA family ATPase [Lachnospiraceae bacterium]|jgi:stage V sporulation protein K